MHSIWDKSGSKKSSLEAVVEKEWVVAYMRDRAMEKCEGVMVRIRVYCSARTRAKSRYMARAQVMFRVRFYCSARAMARSKYRA